MLSRAPMWHSYILHQVQYLFACVQPPTLLSKHTTTSPFNPISSYIKPVGLPIPCFVIDRMLTPHGRRHAHLKPSALFGALPALELPPEIRLMIYELGIHDNIASVKSTAKLDNIFKTLKRQPYLGPLTLIDTTSIIRKESRGAMYSVAHHQWEDPYAPSEPFDGEPMSALRFRSPSRCCEAMKQSQWVGDVWGALAEPCSTSKSHS